MLLITDDTKRTVWHVSAEKSNVEALDKVREWDKWKLKTQEIKYKLKGKHRR